MGDPYRFELDQKDKELVNKSRTVFFLDDNYSNAGIGYEINNGEITHAVLESED